METAAQGLDRAQRRKAANRQKVVDAAHRLFLRKGFTATTISDIAEDADVAKGSVFTHAPNKERLLVLVFDKLMAMWLDGAHNHARKGRGLVNRLDRFFSHLMCSMGEHAELSAIFMAELPFARGEEELADIEKQIDELIAELIDAAKTANEIDRGISTFTLGRNLFYTYYTAQYLWLAAGAPVRDDIVPTLRDQIALQINPLKTRKPEQ